MKKASLLASGALVVAGMLSAQTPFIIASVNSGQVLDVPHLSTTPGTLIQQYPFNGGANQQWTIRRVLSGNRTPYPYAYEIVSANSGLVLDVPNLSTTPGTLIQQYPPNSGTNQQWRFSRAPGSTGYEIISLDQEIIPPDGVGFDWGLNLVLDVPHLSTTPGALIQQYPENDGPNQQWLLYPLALKNIVLWGIGDTITITGWGFQPGSEVCPVFDSTTTKPCEVVPTNGIFSYAASFPGSEYVYDANFIVVTVEDKTGNLLAIGTLTGGLTYATQ